MNPLWLMTRVAGTALLTAAGLSLLFKELRPRSPDFVSGALHFRKGLEEFQKGVSAIMCGTPGPSPEEARKARESSRIPIE